MAGESVSKLTMQAEALGFDTSAKAVDTLALAQARLAENQKQLDQAKTGGNVQDVAKLIDEQQRLGAVIDGLTHSQGKLNASERDWASLLSTIHPSLGGFARTINDLSKVLGDAGSGMSVLSKAGAIALPILAAISAAARAMWVEFTQATEAIRAQERALTELERARRDTTQSIEDIRDASQLKPFTPEESQAAKSTFGRIRQTFPFVGEGALKETLAFTGGASDTPGGGRFGVEDIARFARAAQLHPDKVDVSKARTEDRVAEIVGRVLERFADGLERQFSREGVQAKEARVAAGQEITSSGGPTLNLREIVERRAPEGANVDRLVEIIKQAKTPEELEHSRRLLEMAESGESPGLHVLRRVGQFAGLFGVDVGKLDPRLTSTQADFASLKGVFQEILSEVKRQTEAINAQANRPEAAPVVYNNQNSRTYIQGRGRATNGNTRTTQSESLLGP